MKMETPKEIVTMMKKTAAEHLKSEETQKAVASTLVYQFVIRS